MGSASRLLAEFKESTEPEARMLREFLVSANAEVEGMESIEDLLPYLPKAAESNYVYALYILYRMREEGLVLKKDLEKAFSLCESAASLGYSTAQFDLGTMYAHGLGTQTSYAEAIAWYNTATENNNQEAAYHLGMMYETGMYGCDVDYKMAVKFYERSIQLGSIDAIVSLANLYRKGKGVVKDVKQAIRLYEIAAGKGSIDANMQLGMIYHVEKDGISKDSDKVNSHLNTAEELVANMEKRKDK